MRTRNSLVTLLLVTTLLLAPVSLAGPSGSAGFGWFSQVKAFVVDVFDFFSFGDGPSQSLRSDESGTAEVVRESVYMCPNGEMSPTGDPNGC